MPNGHLLPPNHRLRIVLLGYLVRGPVGGMAWSDLHYLLGLRSLGHDVYFLEDSGDTPWSCYDPAREVTDTNPAYGLSFAAQIFERFGFNDRWAYYDAHADCWSGPCADRIFQICASADLFIDLLGLDLLRPWVMEIPVRVLVDKDPVFRQVRDLTNPGAREIALQHTKFFSFGENLGLECCGIPEDGMAWQATRHPIYLDAWPVRPPLQDGKYTSIMLWNSYAAAEYNGSRYGMKSESFAAYSDLPRHTGRVFELAIGGPDVPVQTLEGNGWKLRNSHEVSRDLWAYQNFIQQSKAEFAIAKHGYVVTNSGWFSERSASYLASGRPVLVQNTGFPAWLPTGCGVVAFSNREEALAGMEDINGRYEVHCRAARAIAEEYFDSQKVLARLIDRAVN